MGRVVAVDPGTKRIGVAVSNSQRTMAFPRPALPAGPEAIVTLCALVRHEAADLVLVGRPISLAGRETDSTAQADQFRAALASNLDGVVVSAVDERLSTVSAQRSLSSAGVRQREQRELIDSAAATVLLQSYLDANSL